MRKISLVFTVLALALIVPLAAQSQAFITMGQSDGSGNNGGSGNPHKINARGTAIGTLYGTVLGGIQVTFACEGTASGVVSHTDVRECFLQNSSGYKWYASPRSVPGNFAATAASRIVPPLPMRVCWTARSTFIVNAEDVLTSGCTPYK